jgi:serine/threonine protein kinase
LAVNYCHNNDVSHRDIKLDNIVVDDETLHVKLIDFGFACLYDPQKGMTDLAGTFAYMAPEIVS